MFIGHFGAGFACKKLDKSTSLGTYFLASQWVDLVWPIFLLLGVEKVEIEPGITTVTPLNFIYYPYTHSLLGIIAWGVLFGLINFLVKKKLKTSIILGALVVSHWVLDLFVHIPDLVVIPGMDLKLGLGLWNSLSGTIIVEGLIFTAGAFIYMKITNARNKIGTYSLLGLVVFLALIYITNLFGPPPESVQSIAIVGNAQWLIILWGYWIDENRE